MAVSPSDSALVSSAPQTASCPGGARARSYRERTGRRALGSYARQRVYRDVPQAFGLRRRVAEGDRTAIGKAGRHWQPPGGDLQLGLETGWQPVYVIKPRRGEPAYRVRRSAGKPGCVPEQVQRCSSGLPSWQRLSYLGVVLELSDNDVLAPLSGDGVRDRTGSRTPHDGDQHSLGVADNEAGISTLLKPEDLTTARVQHRPRLDPPRNIRQNTSQSAQSSLKQPRHPQRFAPPAKRCRATSPASSAPRPRAPATRKTPRARSPRTSRLR